MNERIKNLLTDCGDFISAERHHWVHSYSCGEQDIDDPEVLEEIEKIDSLIARIDEEMETI